MYNLKLSQLQQPQGLKHISVGNGRYRFLFKSSLFSSLLIGFIFSFIKLVTLCYFKGLLYDIYVYMGIHICNFLFLYTQVYICIYIGIYIYVYMYTQVYISPYEVTTRIFVTFLVLSFFSLIFFYNIFFFKICFFCLIFIFYLVYILLIKYIK